jgi:hypothetical protein
MWRSAKLSGLDHHRVVAVNHRERHPQKRTNLETEHTSKEDSRLPGFRPVHSLDRFNHLDDHTSSKMHPGANLRLLRKLISPQTVADGLGASSVESFWIAASYLLSSAGCQPVVASLADICNRLPVFLASVLLFTAGSILCSVCSNVEQMLAGRTIQGIGGGGILSMNLIILSDQIPLRERPRYQGLIQLVFGLGTCLAPILGGALSSIGWRWSVQTSRVFCTILTPKQALLHQHSLLRGSACRCTDLCPESSSRGLKQSHAAIG